jgi:hypothetical protein
VLLPNLPSLIRTHRSQSTLRRLTEKTLLIQQMLHRKGPGSAGKLDKDVNNAVAAFKRFDFEGSARMAREE